MRAALSPARRESSGLGADVSSLSSRIRKRLGGAAAASVQRVTIRTALSPSASFTGEQIFGPPPGAPPARPFRFNELFLRLAKPAFEVQTPAGTIIAAPYGQPTTNYFWPAVILGGAGLTALGVLAFKGWRKG